jgi:hypothetical protein
MQEVWRPVLGYEGLYEVSDQGQVRSVDRIVQAKNGHNKRLKQVLLKRVVVYGYHRVTLSKNGQARSRIVSNLVAEAFLGPRPTGYYVAHGPAGKAYDCVENISYKSPVENALDRWRDGTMFTGERNPMARLTEDSVRLARKQVLNEGATLSKTAKALGVSRRTLRDAINGHTWGWLE